jgi:hypothetical protein
MSTIEDRYAQVEKALEFMGNTHSFPDILALIEDGQMQSFANGETWAVTQIIDFPKKRVLEVFLVTGDLANAEALHDVVIAYAKAHACDFIRAYGRDGWSSRAKERGWTAGARVYTKEVV